MALLADLQKIRKNFLLAKRVPLEYPVYSRNRHIPGTVMEYFFLLAGFPIIAEARCLVACTNESKQHI